VSKQTNDNNISDNSNIANPNVIKDTSNNLEFDVDWETVEKNYKYDSHHPRHHRHHSSSNSDKPTDFNNNSSTNVDKSENFDANASTNKQKHNKLKKDDQTNTHKHKNVKDDNQNLKKKHKKLKIFLIILLSLLIIIAIVLGVLNYIGRKKLLNYRNLHVNVPSGIQYEDDGRIVYYNGHTYEFNDNIASILFMGIDNRKLKDNAVSGTGGQADALYLFTYDTKRGHIKVLSLNRDIMTDISRYDEGGNYVDTATAQLCLAYAYGDGKQTSAENQVTATERLLYNIPINTYYAIDLDAIKILNDDVGGVTVTPDYTFESFTKGQTVTLKGDMAEAFVRHRDTSLLDDNLRRMDCQKQYLTAFASSIVPAIRKDFHVSLDLYKDTTTNTVTNISAPILTYLGWSLATNYTGLNIQSTSGKYVDSPKDSSAEYKISKKKLFETVLDFYYKQID
jgi:LCP family protein required for cell wall assembly